MNNTEIFIVGANGQLGTALREQYPGAKFADRDELDITDKESVHNFDWSGIEYILNAAAFTNVDGAETPEGRVAAWKTNAEAASYLSEVVRMHDITLVHISTDYVFDGTKDLHTEDEDFSPLSVYGASKAAGDIAVALAPKHYILRTSWVIGAGKNFVRSILALGHKGIEPAVVADQFGRPTFTAELVRAIDHLLRTSPEFGTYNISNGGDVISWEDLARSVYNFAGFDLKVTDTTAAEYFAGKIAADRPTHSAFDLSKIEATGFKLTDWREDLKKYIEKEKENS
jgi:dTDP-4-dehydrorhamnose 3,5-epimerase